MRVQQMVPKQTNNKKMLNHVMQNWVLYLFLVPSLVYLLIFNYVPLAGIQMAFRNYKASSGIWHSQWVGFKYFKQFIDSYQFSTLVSNTITLSLYQIIASFPVPIILAILINYTTIPGLKKFSQTITFAPHLISIVVLCGMLIVFSSNAGLFNVLIRLFGGQNTVILGKPNLYQSIYVWSGVWQHAGYNAVIYIAALSAVDDQLHEAAIVDGASKLQRIIHIDFPSLVPTMMVVLILSVGNLLNIGFEKSYLLQNSLNLSKSEIISTYVYKIGLQGAQYSYSTAIGLMNNLLNFFILIFVNSLSAKLTDSSLW